MDFKSLLPSHWGRHAVAPPAPHDPFDDLHREINRLFHEYTRGFRIPTFGGAFSPFSPTNGISGEGPNIDISETDDAYEITADLPGVDQQDVDISLVDNMLVIKGEKRTNHEEKKKDYRLIERSFGSFERMIPVPFNADPEAIKAVFEKGVLTITLAKPPEAKERVKKIPLSADWRG